jgi:predicted dehydrogenase
MGEVKQVIRWGILGPGAISEAFARALAEAAEADLVAVGSRDADRARAFAREHGVRRAHGSYLALAEDPDIDAIYIGTPHACHEEHTVLCLSHGKHVLCEKPLAINAAQAGRMIRAAREHDRLLMEAMWTRFLPSLGQVRQVLASGRIGEPRTLTADFGIQPEFEPQSRLFDLHLGGGALLDLGVYAVSLGHWLFGDPVDIKGTAHLGPTGVDDDSALVLRHGGGQITTAFQSLRIETPREAVIRGTAGWIRLHEPWWGTARLTMGTAAGEQETLDFELKGRGYTHMADAFMELIRAGRGEADVISLEESLAIMETMDTLREQWGLKYPME